MRINPTWFVAAAFCAACGGATADSTTTTVAATTPDSAARDSASSAAKANVGPPFDTLAAQGKRPLVREVYQYQGTSRDPFKPLVIAVQRGPALTDLRLVAILYDGNDPSGSIATFRDIGNDHRYTVSPGQRIGRLSVVNVSATTVRLRQDDFGTPRDQVYSLRKPEDANP